MRSIAVVVLVVFAAGAAAARGGNRTWILVCGKSLPKSDCNLTTAARWFALPAPQGSAATPAIAAARARIAATLGPGEYMSVEQFPAGVSMGARGNVFRACDAEPATPADAQQADWAARGECLR